MCCLKIKSECQRTERNERSLTLGLMKCNVDVTEFQEVTFSVFIIVFVFILCLLSEDVCRVIDLDRFTGVWLTFPPTLHRLLVFS